MARSRRVARRTRPAQRKMARGGRTRQAPRKMARGGRKFQTGGHTHGDYQTVGMSGDPGGNHQHWVTSASASLGPHQHPRGLPPRQGSVIPGGHRRGGKVTHKLRRGGRTRPVPTRGRRMVRGGRAGVSRGIKGKLHAASGMPQQNDPCGLGYIQDVMGGCQTDMNW